MKRLGVMVLLAVLASPAGAQVIVGLGGGSGIGTRGGSASSAHETGFVELDLPILPALRIEALNANTDGAGTVSVITTGVFSLPLPVIRPYALAGWGLYGLDGNGSRGGWNLGVGARTALPTGPSFFVEIRRHQRIPRDLLTFGVRL